MSSCVQISGILKNNSEKKTFSNKSVCFSDEPQIFEVPNKCQSRFSIYVSYIFDCDDCMAVYKGLHHFRVCISACGKQKFLCLYCYNIHKIYHRERKL
jgi:hypothetical protein